MKREKMSVNIIYQNYWTTTPVAVIVVFIVVAVVMVVSDFQVNTN